MYTDEDIQIMTGEKSPIHEPTSPANKPSTGSVAQFFAQACQQEQIQQTKSEVSSKVEPDTIMQQHPPGVVVTGGPPVMRLPVPTTTGPIPGKNFIHDI